MSTTTGFKADLYKDLLTPLRDSIEEGTKHAYRMLWDVFIDLLISHWLLVLSFLGVILLAAFVRYVVTGRWAVLGSVLYSYFFWGTMFLIGFSFGPEVYANDYFPIVSLVLWPISYLAAGSILWRIGITGTRRF